MNKRIKILICNQNKKPVSINSVDNDNIAEDSSNKKIIVLSYINKISELIFYQR